jgi:phage gp29-like protein
MSRGIWVSDTEFVRFSEKTDAADLSTHMATRLRVGDLAGMWGVLPNPDPILRRMGRQVQVYRELRSDAMVKSGTKRRRAAVVGLESGFARDTKASPRLVKNVQAVFADLPIKRLIRDLVDGAFYGYAVAEVIWGRVGGLVVPVDVVVKPSEWFGFNGDNQLVLRDIGSLAGTVVPDRKFLVVGNERTYANPYGEADLASCFWPVAFRKGGLKFWVTFAEKYGMPWAVGKQPRSANAKDADDLADKLANMVRDAVAVIPDDASVDLIQSQTTANADMYEALLMYCSREINISLLGNNQSTELQSNKASATAASGVEDSLRDADADMSAEALSCLARWVADVNWPSALVPEYEFWEQEEIDELQAKRDKTLTDAGVQFTPEYWMRTYDLQPGDLVTQPVAPAGPDQVALAEGDVPPDQAALDEAMANLPADEIQAAMATMLKPALEAIATADTPDQVLAALAEAYPRMDSSELETLLQRALFVSDLVGRHGVATEAKADSQGA